MTSQTNNNPGKTVSIWATIFIVVAVVGMLGSLPVEHPTPMLYLAVIGLGGAFISLIWNISSHKDETSPLVTQGEKSLESLKNILTELKTEKQSTELSEILEELKSQKLEQGRIREGLKELAVSINMDKLSDKLGSLESLKETLESQSKANQENLLSAVTRIQDSQQSSLEKLVENMDRSQEGSNVSLKKISEGLGNGNVQLAEEIKRLSDGIHEQLQLASKTNQARIGELADAVQKAQEMANLSLAQKIDEFKEQINSSQEKSAQLMGDKLEPALGRISEALSSAGGSQNTAEELRHTLSDLKSTLDKMREDVSTQNETLKESLSTQSYEIVEELKNQGAMDREEIKGLALSSESASGDTGMLGSAIENLGGRLEEMLSQGREEMAALIEGQKELQDLLKNQVEPMAESQASNFGNAVEKLAGVSEGLSKAGKLLEEASTTQHLNQSSLQAGIEMLNTSLLDIMEKLDSGHKQSEEQNEFIEKLYKTLEAFHEKATEILIENSLKTREVLLHGLPDTANPTLDL